MSIISTLAVSGSALPPPAPLWSTGSCPLGFCNRSNLAQIGPMRGRAADGIERVAADEQVEIGACLAKRIVGRCTECRAALPPAMFAHYDARIEVRVEMGAGAHAARRCCDRDPVALGDLACPRCLRVQCHGGLWNALAQ